MFYNTVTGQPSMAADDRDVPAYDIGPSPGEPTSAAPTRPSAASAPPAAWTIPPTMTAVDCKREYDRLRAEWSADLSHHVLGDDRHREHAQALAYYLALGERADGRDPAEGEAVIGELIGDRIRALGADALSPAPRPTLPEGYEWDEAALVLGETEAHAMDMPPHLVMTVTDELATMIEQEEHRGTGWSREDGLAELTRWYGTEGAARVVADAQWTLEALATSEHPLLRERAHELVEGRPNDPYLTKILGVTLYEAIQNAPPSAKLEALLLRRVERQQKVEAAARAEAAKLRQQEEAEADEARAASMERVAGMHRRWGKSEP